MKILIFGYGYIAHKIRGFFPDSIMCNHKVYTIGDIHKEVVNVNPDIVINCIGKTGTPNIDWCEDNKEETFFTNVTLPFLIREVCSAKNIRMVHISSGCIYEGNNHYQESDEPNFKGSFYSRTKYLCEKGLWEFNVLQLRIRMPLDKFEHPRNLLTKLINYKDTINIVNSVTVIDDFLNALDFLIKKNETGIFNIVSQDISHSEILDIYNSCASVKKEINEITMEELNSITIARRSNCTLSINKLCNLGFKMPKNSIRKCIQEYSKNIGIENAVYGRI